MRSDGPGLGVIGEDETDCATLRVLIKRLAGEKTKVHARYGNGCSAIFRKASAWMHELARAGCRAIVIVHDLDRDPRNGMLNTERILRDGLERLAVPAGIVRLVCIPVEEIEAWFWSDPATLRRVARREIAASLHPHAIAKPKEALMSLSRIDGGSATYRTAGNKDLAGLLDLNLCAARCPAFRDLATFVRAAV